MFDKYQLKYREEKKEIELQLAKTGKKVSNLDQHIKAAIEFSSKLATVWHTSDYAQKQALQFLVFPDGIYYNRKKDRCRTPKVNEVIRYFAGLARVSEGKEKGNFNQKLKFVCLVD